MNYDIENINRIINGDLIGKGSSTNITHLLTDSRKLIFPAETLFFAITTNRRDGHEFIKTLYVTGVRNFVVSRLPGLTAPPDANFIVVRDSVEALQRLAEVHRHRFSIPVIGITGSNGKTIVKEWLNELLVNDYQIVRSPASYNSQIGVPLSIWLMNENHNLAIFEAGISRAGEMEKVQPVIDPSIGILTNIGEAHNEGFENHEQKIREKLALFKNAGLLIYHSDDPVTDKIIREQQSSSTKLFSWGSGKAASLLITGIKKQNRLTDISASLQSSIIDITIPFTDDASIENAIHCWCVMLSLGIDSNTIRSRMKNLNPVAMRLELKSGINNTSIINDSYSSDLSSLRIALDFVSQQKQHQTKTVILSDILQSGLNNNRLYGEVAALLQQHSINRLIGIGEGISSYTTVFETNALLETSFFPTVAAFRRAFSKLSFRDETILIKGARVFELEGIEQLLQQKVHQTVLEIDLNAIVHNLNEYRKMLRPETKIMAMVKAFSYGSGSFEIANVLQFHKVDYLAVAYADEGVALRKGGISVPIMVMNTDAAGFDVLVQYNLEPDLYSTDIFQQFSDYLSQNGIVDFPVHIELETGMNRLGFAEADIHFLTQAFGEPNGTEKSSSNSGKQMFRVKSIFSHLSASEDPAFDDFTTQQIARFEKLSSELEKHLPYPVIKHIANSSGASRHSDYQMDMVRIGIGLYGIDKGMKSHGELTEVSALKSTIAQIKHLTKGETVSYGRSGRLSRDSVIATVRIGYADGYSRKLGNGRGYMIVNGVRAPVTGSVCMDMTMIDITGIPNVSVGDEVTVFGSGLSVQEMAEWAETIPYEILTGVSQRVKRVYFEE